MAVLPIVIEIFKSESEWWTDQMIHSANVAKKYFDIL